MNLLKELFIETFLNADSIMIDDYFFLFYEKTLQEETDPSDTVIEIIDTDRDLHFIFTAEDLSENVKLSDDVWHVGGAEVKFYSVNPLNYESGDSQDLESAPPENIKSIGGNLFETLRKIRSREAAGESNSDHFDLLVELKESLEAIVSDTDKSIFFIAGIHFENQVSIQDSDFLREYLLPTLENARQNGQFDTKAGNECRYLTVSNELCQPGVDRWEVLEYAGMYNQSCVHTSTSHSLALKYIGDNYSPSEAKELGVDVTCNGSTEY